MHHGNYFFYAADCPGLGPSAAVKKKSKKMIFQKHPHFGLRRQFWKSCPSLGISVANLVANLRIGVLGMT